MTTGTGRIVCGIAYLTEGEAKLLEERLKRLKAQFPESGLTRNRFLDAALRVGIEIELKAARDEMEAENHVKHE